MIIQEPVAVVVFCLVALITGFTNAETSVASPNTTVVYDPGQLSASIVYEQNVADQRIHTVTYFSQQTETTTTVAIPISTALIGGAAALVKADSLAYTLPLAASGVLHSLTNITIGDGGKTPAPVGLCWYPVSGYYGPFARFLLYGTMFFAVLMHRHEWLIMGALATGLTFTAVAAIQVLVMTFTNQGIANPDGLCILGLLAFSLAMLVPLLSWSSTINKLGAEHPEDSVGRSIIIVWGFLLTAALLSVFIGNLKAYAPDDPSTWNAAVKTPVSFYWFAAAKDITCTPGSGVFNMAAGQDSHWSSLYVTHEFVEENNCRNPCRDGVNWPNENWKTMFRDPEDLIVLNMHQVNTFIAVTSESKKVLTPIQRIGILVADSFVAIGPMFMFLIIIHGVWAVLLGRRSPAEVRNFVYWFITHMIPRKDGKPRKERRWLHIIAKLAAVGVYVWTILTSIFAIFFIVLSIYATEYLMHEIPQSGHNFEVDQWAAIVATAMVLIAAVIFQFQGIIVDATIRAVNRIMLWIHDSLHKRTKLSCEVVMQEHFKSRDKGSSAKPSIKPRKFKNFWQRKAELAEDNVKKTKTGWQDWMDFWHNPKRVVKVHGSMGNTHVRSRRAAGEETPELIEVWKKRSGDDWMVIEEFIAACRNFDERSRMSGKLYKFKPRIVEESESEERARFNWRLVQDIFRSHHDRSPWSAMPGLQSDLRLTDSGPLEVSFASHDAVSRNGFDREDMELDVLRRREVTAEDEAIERVGTTTYDETGRKTFSPSQYSPLQ